MDKLRANNRYDKSPNRANKLKSWGNNLIAQLETGAHVAGATLPNSAEIILSRIDTRLREVGLTDNAASALAGQRDLIRTLRRNVAEGKQTEVKTSTLRLLAPVLQTSAEWLYSGSGQKVVPPKGVVQDRAEIETAAADDELAGIKNRISTLRPYKSRVPHGSPVIGANLSAGGGAAEPQTTLTAHNGITYSADAVVGEIVMPPEVLGAITKAPPERVHWLEVSGGSMEPTLHNGDYVALNTLDTNIGGGDIFAFRDQHGDLLVKRLKRVGDVVEVISDNPRIGNSALPISEITIFGRVVGRISKVTG